MDTYCANPNIQQLPMPSSLAEVENLIRALYQPNSPETISQIQDVLQRVQRSPEGWRLAQDLFHTRDDNIRFYAALTIIVKLNRDSDGLSDNLSQELLQSIINWTIQSVTEGSAAFVSKKLCSALVTYFLHFPHIWTQPLRHLICCLDIGHATPIESFDDKLPVAPLVENLDPQRLKVAVWFATLLAEDVGKTEVHSSSSRLLNVHESAVKVGPDLAYLLARGFSLPPDSPGSSLQSDSLTCYQAWILYAQRAPSGKSSILLDHLRQLVPPALQCFTSPQLFQATAELFSDVLSNYSSFFTHPQYESLAAMFDSPWAEEHYDQLVHGKSHDDDGIHFGLLMLAYGDAKVEQLMTSTQESSHKFLSKLAGLLAADGYLVGEDAIFVPALEFWSTFVETMVDKVWVVPDDDPDEEPQKQTPDWRPLAEQHLRTVVMNCWRKVQWPPVEVFGEWDSSERVGFSDARKDVADMLQAVHTLNSGNLISFFADLFLQSLAAQSWPEVEASLFCLGSLSDCISESDEMDGYLTKVFGSGFFDMMSSSSEQQQSNQQGDGSAIPLRLRQTGLQLIERYKEYFERHAEYLPHALNLLFVAVDDPVLGSHSAKAISSLCLSCRAILTSQVDAFIQQYQRIRSSRQVILDSLAEERIVLAVAGIVQAVSGEGDRRWDAFEKLYGFIRADFERAVRLKADPRLLNLQDPDYIRGVVVEPPTTHGTRLHNHLQQLQQRQGAVLSAEEIALQIALRGLRCLSNLAKGMQDTVERFTDVEALDEKGHYMPTVQVTGKLAAIQSDIISLLTEIQRTFPASGEVVESVCNIYRAGFSETDPGPFVFPPDAVTGFFASQGTQTPRLGTLLSTACSFVGSLYRDITFLGLDKRVVRAQLGRLLPWVIELLQGMGEPENDTEITQNGISFVARVLSKDPDVLFQIQPQQLLEFFFLFSLKVLDGKEPLPKGAAADFWSAFISLKPSPDSPELSQFITTAMESTLGPLVAQSLMRNIGGNAARSELDKLSDPLKKLVTHQVHAQRWLEQALFRDEQFPAKKNVTDQDKMMFLKKVIGLRGSRQTNTVVREFWMACRGVNFGYAS